MNKILNSDGYPDEISLERIKNWDIRGQGIKGLLDLIQENTNWADRQITRRGTRVIYFYYSTGGWSGNEAVINALRKHSSFWALYWVEHKRGGHYHFRIPCGGLAR